MLEKIIAGEDLRVGDMVEMRNDGKVYKVKITHCMCNQNKHHGSLDFGGCLCYWQGVSNTAKKLI